MVEDETEAVRLSGRMLAGVGGGAGGQVGRGYM